MKSYVRVTRDQRVALVEFSAPERRNALSRPLLRELHASLAGEAVGGSRAVVLTGAEGVFSAGADLAELTGTASDRAIDDDVAVVVDVLRHLPAPVIAAVEGPCIGAAVDLMLACDLSVVSETAFFEVPSVRLGLLYSPMAVARWQRALRRSALRRMLLFGERFDALAAFEAGVVDQVVPAGKAMEESVALAHRAAPPGDAAAATKHLLVSLEDGTFDQPVWEEQRERLLSSEERRRAVAVAKGHGAGLS